MNFNRKLILADGTVFPGNGFGQQSEVACEVIFHTGMTGYEDILTDGTYYGQAVVMTYPLIGNYGISQEVIDAPANGLSALIVKEYCEIPSNWQSVATLDSTLKVKNIVGLCDVDTRALTIKIREAGTMRGIIVDFNVSTEEAISRLVTIPEITDQAQQVTMKASYRVVVKKKKHKILYIAFGAKNEAIIDELTDRDCEVIIMPFFHTTLDEITKINPNGVILGNGPGNPADLEILTLVDKVVKNYPTFGIGLGHQLVAVVGKARVSKMKFGHHGNNIPVRDVNTGRTLITSQNHNYVVDQESLVTTDFEVSHFAINDETVQGIKHKFLPVFGVQFMPEVHTGPADSKYLFDQFINSLAGGVE